MDENERTDDEEDSKTGAGHFAPNNQDKPDKDQSGTCQEQQNGEESYWQAWQPLVRLWKRLSTFEQVSVVIQAVPGIAIVLYTVFSCLQWKEMHRLNNITEQAFRQGARARFDPESFTVNDRVLNKNGEILPVDVTVRNIGRSNAHVSISGEIRVGGQGITIPRCNNAPASLEMTAPVNAGRTTGFEFSGRQLTQEQVALFETGKIRVFAVGKIRSTDEIGETHCTLICAAFDSPVSLQMDEVSVNQTWVKCGINGEEDD